MGVPKRLTEMQKRFAEYLVEQQALMRQLLQDIVKKEHVLKHQNYKTLGYLH